MERRSSINTTSVLSLASIIAWHRDSCFSCISSPLLRHTANTIHLSNRTEPYRTAHVKIKVKIITFVFSDVIGLFFRVRQNIDLSSNRMKRATRFVRLKLSVYQMKCTFHPFILMGMTVLVLLRLQPARDLRHTAVCLTTSS